MNEWFQGGQLSNEITSIIMSDFMKKKCINRIHGILFTLIKFVEQIYNAHNIKENFTKKNNNKTNKSKIK